MKRKVTLLLLLLTLGINVQNAQETVVVTNIDLVNVATGKLEEHKKNIWITAGRISAISDYDTPLTDKTIETLIDGTGKYAVPGLWDMHAHPDDPEMWRMQPDGRSRDLILPLFVLNGVTGIRDMAGNMELIKEWREKIEEKVLLGPEIIGCGPLLDGPNPMWDGSVGISKLSRVQQVVDSLKASGADFLKVYSLLPDSTYFELSSYAKSINFPFVGHVPFTVSTGDASETGMKSQEHLLNVLIDCSDISEALYNNSLNYNGISDPLQKYLYRNELMLKAYNPKRARALFQKFVENGTWHTPTISMWFKNAYYEQEIVKDSLLYSYLPSYMRRYWTPEINDHLQRRQPGIVALKQKLVAKYMEVIGEMHKAGVGLLAGTDMGANPLCFPGVGVHNELRLFVECGLSPAEALKTATLNPALFLEIQEDYGTIEKGKVADILILNANPLDNISNTEKIHTVIRKGEIWNRENIDKMLGEIKQFQSE